MAGCMFVQLTHCFYGFEEFHSQRILFNSFKETSISPSILPSTLCRDTEGRSICQHSIFPAYIYYELGQVSTLTGRPYISRRNHTWSPFRSLFTSYHTFASCVPVMLHIEIYTKPISLWACFTYKYYILHPKIHLHFNEVNAHIQQGRCCHRTNQQGACDGLTL